MPLLRARELAVILEKAQIRLALCDERLGEELEQARAPRAGLRTHLLLQRLGTPSAGAELEARMRRRAPDFDNVDTAKDDVALIAFTSGTTGKPKGTMHFHRDVMAICDCFPRSTLRPAADDVFIGSPPIGFTFGLGGVVTFRWASAPLPCCSRRRRPTCCSRRSSAFEPSAHLADRLPHDAGQGGRRRSHEPLKVRLGRRAAAAPHLRGVAQDDGPLDHRRHRLDRDAAHLHLGRGQRHPAGRYRAPDPGYRAMVVDDDTRPLPAERSAGSRCAARPAVAIADERQKEYVRRLERHGRRLQGRRGRLFLVPGAHRRHDHLRRLQHRRARGSRRCSSTTPSPSAR